MYANGFSLKQQAFAWFSLGMAVYFVWLAGGGVTLVHPIIFLTLPFAITLTPLYLLVPGSRSRKGSSKSDKICFFSLMGGSMFGIFLGLLAKYIWWP